MATENHRRFLSHLRESSAAVACVAQWLSRSGRDVLIKGIQYAGEHGEWKGFADGGDLFILKRIEVKHIGKDFSGPDDWPFGSYFIVCAKHSFDRAREKPGAFIIVSHNMKNCAIVSGASSKHWYEEERTDSRYTGEEATQLFYFCPLEHVKFKTLSEEFSE